VYFVLMLAKPLAAALVPTLPQKTPVSSLTTAETYLRSEQPVEGSNALGEHRSHLENIQILVVIATPSQRSEVHKEDWRQLGEYLVGVKRVPCKRRGGAGV
jgi:hypothetical protein